MENKSRKTCGNNMKLRAASVGGFMSRLILCAAWSTLAQGGAARAMHLGSSRHHELGDALLSAALCEKVTLTLACAQHGRLRPGVVQVELWVWSAARRHNAQGALAAFQCLVSVTFSCAHAQHSRLRPGVVQPELRVWAAAGADERAGEARAAQQRILVRRPPCPAMQPANHEPGSHAQHPHQDVL